ncbi:putative poly-gamma-glutamate biosynthesis enzyme [Candidatus Paraburkholderia kirkii UZHbot1]|uniref:Putative poly-gamma-glutamate biosynthesis enzyme n=1 Tax=Candidatus Paraburkholderia kirkii UZHbot1 TaxID=1055526 RepID=G4M3W4_9BURK|nr:putative poly-gamma-glutamate biosynthesis enzyme [Candidatus Paraburkholderia kirkii UZHbot1]
MARILRKWFEGFYRHLHLEDGRWPSKCIHKEIAYLLKSRFPCQTTLDDECINHFSKASRYFNTYHNLNHKKQYEAGSTEITITLVGDILFTPGSVINYLADSVFRFFCDADCIIINLETPISSEHAIPKYAAETFNSSSDILHPWERVLGQKIFSLCNNHALDCGISGLDNTARIIKTQPNASVLGGASKGDEQLILETNGFKIGLIGITHGVNKHQDDAAGTGIPIIHLTKPNCDIELQYIKSRVKKLIKEQCDIIILVAHWGYEHEHWPNFHQRMNAYRLIEMGVDVIFGHSPHVVQPVEYISIDGFDKDCPTQLSRGEEPRQAIILYSVGNALSYMMGREAKSGIFPKLTFRLIQGISQKRLEIKSMRIMPIKTQMTKEGCKIYEIENGDKYFWHWFFKI